MDAGTQSMCFRHFALIHHDDLRVPRSELVDLKDYPAAITERLIGERRYRRDPVIRGCIFADGAFLWSDLPQIIHLDRHDRSEEHTSELQSLMRISYAVFCLKKKTTQVRTTHKPPTPKIQQ